MRKKAIVVIAIIAKLKKAIMNLRKIFSLFSWKTKATARAKEINSLTKRNKELIESRDKIKAKYQKLIMANIELEKRIKDIEFELKKN
jgi:hypothetical protein